MSYAKNYWIGSVAAASLIPCAIGASVAFKLVPSRKFQMPHPKKWVLVRSPVNFLTFVLALCTWIKNIVVKPR